MELSYLTATQDEDRSGNHASGSRGHRRASAMISVDTNILVYATNPEAAKHAEALAFMQSLAQEEIALCELVLIECQFLCP